MSLKILITTPGYPWYNHTYSIQGYYLLKMFVELNYDIIYVSFSEKSLSQELKTFFQVANMENNDDIYLINNYINKDNLELFSKAKYCGIKYIDNTDNITVSNYNKIIDENNINYIFILGELTNFISDEYFRCKSIIWFPNYYEPLDNNNKSKLSLFDKILCFNPSSINIIKTCFNDNLSISYAPHIINYDHIINLQKIVIQSKEELMIKYKIPVSSIIISVISPNCDKNMRKGFDTSLQIFNNIYKQYPNVFLYIQSVTYKIQHYDNDIEKIANYLNIPKNKYIINTKHISSIELEEIYKMTDLILVCNKTEGLGISLIEAQIRGIPIVSNKFTAMRDYTFYGISCDPDQLYYDGYSGGMISMPSVKNMTEGVVKILNDINFNEKKMLTIERIKIQMSYDTLKIQMDNELKSIKDSERYTYCFVLDEDCETTRNDIKNIKKKCIIITSDNWSDIYDIKYQYLVMIHYKCHINPLFFNLIKNLLSGVVLKTRYQNGMIYPNSIDDILTFIRKNNIVMPKNDVDIFVKNDVIKRSSQYLNDDILNFSDFYDEIISKYIELKKLSTTEHIIIDVL
jgi:hypothetical protein